MARATVEKWGNLWVAKLDALLVDETDGERVVLTVALLGRVVVGLMAVPSVLK